MLKNQIKQKIIQKAISLEKWGSNDLAWTKEDALNLIKALLKDEIGIFGGDVYKLEKGNWFPTYDNWYCNPKEGEAREDYFLRSKQHSLSYIEKYPLKAENILFAIVFTERVEIDEEQLNGETGILAEENWVICPYCFEPLEPPQIDLVLVCPKCSQYFSNPLQNKSRSQEKHDDN